MQNAANGALVKIEEKSNTIQTQVGGMFDKTLEAAISKQEQLSTDFDGINEQLKTTGEEIIAAARKEIGTAGSSEQIKLQRVVELQLQEVKKLVESTRSNAKEAVSEIHSPNIPSPRMFFSMVSLASSEILLFGGSADPNSEIFEDIWKYEMNTNEWKAISSEKSLTTSSANLGTDKFSSISSTSLINQTTSIEIIWVCLIIGSIGLMRRKF